MDMEKTEQIQKYLGAKNENLGNRLHFGVKRENRRIKKDS